MDDIKTLLQRNIINNTRQNIRYEMKMTNHVMVRVIYPEMKIILHHK